MQSVANEDEDEPKKKKQGREERNQDALRVEELLQTGVKWFYWIGGVPAVGIKS